MRDIMSIVEIKILSISHRGGLIHAVLGVFNVEVVILIMCLNGYFNNVKVSHVCDLLHSVSLRRSTCHRLFRNRARLDFHRCRRVDYPFNRIQIHKREYVRCKFVTIGIFFVLNCMSLNVVGNIEPFFSFDCYCYFSCLS